MQRKGLTGVIASVRGLLRLLAFVLMLGGSWSAHAASAFCSQYPLDPTGTFHVINGNDPTLTTATLPSSIGLDAPCYIENFLQSAKWPLGLTSTINYKQTTPPILAVFTNVYYNGNMACSNTNTMLWFVNSSFAGNNQCQAIMIPVEAIGKYSPGPTATIGVPFTYTMTIPVMYSAGTYTTQPSTNTLANATLYDDLTATGASMTYVTNTASLINGATVTPIGTLTLGANPTTLTSLAIPASDSTKHIVFSCDYNPSLCNITAGTQIQIKMTVVLDNVPTNAAGTTFTNTANWWFGRIINGVTYNPLPGQGGVAAPMTIIEPNLTLQKSSTYTNLNVGTAAPFTLNVQNTGGGTAYNAQITDVLPTGMCTYNPTPSVTARVYDSTGATPVSPVLVAGTDYTVTYSGCQLTLNMLNTAAAAIPPTDRLIVTYNAALDPSTPPGGTYTNVAGATLWYSAPSGTVGARQYNQTLTNGTPGVLDFQDAYTITSATQGYFFLKSVADLTTGQNPAVAAYPGDTLLYTFQIQNFTFPTLNNISAKDDFDALNATPSFQAGTLTLVNSNLPAGTLTVNPIGGINGTGSFSIAGLNLGSNQQYTFQMSVKLAPTLTNNTLVLNQGNMSGTDPSNVVWSGGSDNPYDANGVQLLCKTTPCPTDPTPITVNAPGALTKANPAQTTATIGQTYTYQITVPATPVNVPLYDVKILDNLGASAANMTFVSASVVSGGAWSLTNTGTSTNLVLQDTNTGIDIPAGGQAVINVTVQLANTSTNVAGVAFANTASYTYDKINGNTATQGTGAAGTTANMTVVEPALSITKAVSYANPVQANTVPAVTGNTLQYTITVKNNGTSTAYDADVLDALPSNLSLVAGSETATINGTPVTGFVQTPTLLASGYLAWGAQNGDTSLVIPVNGTLVLSFQATVLWTNGTSIVNTAYTDWTSLSGVTGERTGAGCPFVTAPNLYCANMATPATATIATIDPTALTKVVTSDTWVTTPSTATDATLRAGDLVTYTLTTTLGSGTTQNMVLTDTLPAGMVFDHVVSINGVTTAPYGSVAPFVYNSFAGPTLSNGNTTSTWNFGNVTNTAAGNSNFIVVYAARVTNTVAQLPTAQLLTNNAALNYAINGVAGTTKIATASINLWQPLLGISKSAVTAAGGTVLVANELVTYTVSMTNTGNAPAYNPVLQDTLPIGMRAKTPVTTNVSLVNGATTTVLPNLTPTYNATTGVVTWTFDNGTANTYTIPAGATLQVVYQASTDPTIGAGMMLTNAAQATHYYSLDSTDANTAFRKDYGATGVASVTLTTASPTALSKAATVTTAAIGQPFTYQITVPATPQATALYDVRVLDDISLATTGVSLTYLNSSAALKSGARSWAALTNSGTATSLILSDATAGGGLDIPAGDQLVVTVTVELANDPTNNTAGKQFTNTANYTYDSVNNNTATQAAGGPGASGAVTIVAPYLQMAKTGPATMLNGVPATFTLTATNTGGATAWKPVISDILPTTATGGMCGNAPTNVTATVTNGATTTTLVSGTDFTVGWAAAPTCTLTVSMLTTAASVPPTAVLTINYSAQLDAGTASGLALTNIAGATQWLTADPAAAGATAATINNTLTNGTPTVTTDFQAAFTTTTAAPTLTFTKTVFDQTTGQSGATAKPGDVLQYTLTLTNTSAVAASNFSLTDTLDNLNNPAAFVPGTLVLGALPAGASAALTSATGGAKGTGIVNITGLSVAAGATVTIQFTAQLVPVINNGTVVLNQAQVTGGNISTQLSDDPSLPGTTDPTRTVISSAPAWQVLKTVKDITSGTNVVAPGDVLQYTITVKNTGTENANNVTLTDTVPTFTTYVAGSTRMNGLVVADPAAGVSALQNGLLINAPNNTTPGVMLADATASTGNVATITFQVKISATALSGTIISNQGFVNGSGTTTGAFPTAPSDDPTTAALNDPTRVILGNLPLLNATKTVTFAPGGDLNNNGAYDVGDIVRYTITVANSGSAPATGATLTDPLPANTTYQTGTTTLNTVAVADVGTASALQNGMAINSTGAASGTIAAGASAVITFDAKIASTATAGTVISNQGSLTSTQLPALQTDADGNPANGYQPTTFVVGSAQQVSITKQVSVVGGGAALPGSQLDYIVQVTNTGTVAATNVVITDDLTALAGQVTYVAGSATLNASTAGVTTSGATLITANYGATYGSLAPGATATLQFKVTINAGLATGTTITNTGQVAWNNPALTATASASISVGATPGTATLSGHLWYDANFNKTADAGELNLSGWAVSVYRNGVLLGSVLSDANGLYSIPGLAPTTPTDQYALRFFAPGASATTAPLGFASSPFTNGLQRIFNITAPSGGIVTGLDLPINPDGVVYNSVLRTPVAGATVTLLQTSTKMPLSTMCFSDPAEQGQVTLASGYYRFDLNFADPSCAPGSNYLIQVTPPPGYVAGTSKLVPATTDSTTASFNVQTCTNGGIGDAIPATAECEAAPTSTQPGTAVPANTAGTTYYLNLLFSQIPTAPQTEQIYDNHIPLDPKMGNAVMITKTAAKQNVHKGDLIPYTITVNNTLAANLTGMNVVDNFPPGFKYVVGSGRLDGAPIEPVVNGPARTLTWRNLSLPPNTRRVIKLMLIVGGGVGEGQYVNRAQVINSVNNSAASLVAEATVRVVPDPTLDCSDVIGKVFDDKNMNGYQDQGEPGLPGVRVATVNGLLITTDQFGRFHITCAVVPDPDRGSNFILKVDERSLPSGYRLTTENPRVIRATRGKMLKFTFGAAIHRVVKMDMFDGVFEPGKTVLRVQWRARIGLLMNALKQGPSVLRLTYYADTENEGLAKDRLQAIKRKIENLWKTDGGDYNLTVETEIFWRTGGPPPGGGDREDSPAADDATTAGESAAAHDTTSGSGGTAAGAIDAKAPPSDTGTGTPSGKSGE